MRNIILAVSTIAALGSPAFGAKARSTTPQEINPNARGSGKTQSHQSFDVNVVSILFPYVASSHVLYPNLSLNTKSNRGDLLLSKELFTTIDRKVQAQSGFWNRAPYQDWRIVGLRYDPCLPQSEAPPLVCLEEIRLIAQPLDRKFGGLRDLAIHLSYLINRNDLQKRSDLAATAQKAVERSQNASAGAPNLDQGILSALLKLKDLSESSGADIQGAALGIHPGLKLEQKKHQTHDVAKLITDLISKNAGESKLIEVTFTDSNEDQSGEWVFMGGPVENTGASKTWTPTQIPLLAPGTLAQTEGQFGSVDFVPVRSAIPPQGSSLTRDISALPNMSWFLSRDVGPMPSSTVQGQSRSIETQEVPSRQDLQSLFVVRNPDLSHPHNTDCVSCHLNAQHMQTFQPSETVAGTFLFKSPPGVSGTIRNDLLPKSSEDVRMFGYRGEAASVSPVTVNSSAAVAAKLNRYFAR